MDRSSPWVSGLIARAVTLAGVGVLSFGTQSELLWLVLGMVILGGGVILLQRDHRKHTDPTTALRHRWRFWAACGTVGVGGLAIFAGIHYRVNGLAFAGLLLAIVGLGGLLAEWRSSTALAPWRGPAILVLCAVAFFVGSSQLTPGLPPAAIAAVAAGLFIAPIGISLTSEDLLDGRLGLPVPADRRRFVQLFAGAGIGLTSAAFFWLVSGPATLELLLIGFAVAGVLVWLMTISAQGDIALLAIVVAAAGLSAHVDTDPLVEELGADAGETVVVALGDSYMSGEGADRFLDGTNAKGSNECRRAATAWMPQLFEGEAGGVAGATDLVFLACSGARGHQLYGAAQGTRADTARNVDDGVDRRQLNQLAHLERVRTLDDLDVELLVVSIGGNDAGFAAIGTACAAPGDCDKSRLADQWLDELPAVAAKLDAAYFEIARAVDGRFPVAVVPYPVPLTPEGCAGSLMSPGEHAFLTRFVQELDATIEATAAKYGFRYVEPMERALGDGPRDPDGWRLCDREKPGVNSVAIFSVNGLVEEQLNPANWLHNSFHPNEDGHRQLAGVFESWLDDQDDLRAPPRLAADARRPVVTEAEREARPCEITETGPQVCDTDSRDWAVDRTTELVQRNLVQLGLGLLGLWLLSLALVCEYRWRRQTRPV